jgi:hypothetical protein
VQSPLGQVHLGSEEEQSPLVQVHLGSEEEQSPLAECIFLIRAP